MIDDEVYVLLDMAGIRLHCGVQAVLVEAASSRLGYVIATSSSPNKLKHQCTSKQKEKKKNILYPLSQGKSVQTLSIC